MTDVVVVGAGLGGLSTAARLAKLGHSVVVCERTSEPGGLLRQVRRDGFQWDAVPMPITVPAVVRDLFRKSGRPLERYVDLQLSQPARRHLFGHGSVLDLPTGSRGAQLDAVSGALGDRAGQAWTEFVDAQADDWEALRSLVLDTPTGAAVFADRVARKALDARGSLDRLLRKVFRDERLRSLASYPVLRTGAAARDEPAFRAVECYVDRTFGVWQARGGAAALANALVTRMGERSVEVRYGAEVTAIDTAAGRARGVVLASGERLDADVIVTAVAPVHVFEGLIQDSQVRRAASVLAPSASARGARPVSTAYLGLAGDPPDLPGTVVLHGEPLITLAANGSAPPEGSAWTAVSVGRADDDVLETMARRGVDLRGSVVTRTDSAAEVSHGVGWEGPRRAAQRAALSAPLPGLYCLGTALVLGASMPYVAWQAAHVATLVGKAT